MKNKPCKVTFFPSNEGKIRYFVKGEEAFTADIDNLISTDHCVTLGNKKSRVMLEEHLSAAMAFCGIDSVDICMDESEVPACIYTACKEVAFEAMQTIIKDPRVLKTIRRYEER